MEVVETLNAAIGGKLTDSSIYRRERGCTSVGQASQGIPDVGPDILAIKVRGSQGQLVPLGEVARVEQGTIDRSIYRKNLKRVVYVTADISGAEESPVYAIMKLNREIDRLNLKEGYRLERYVAAQPFTTEQYALKWDGEWHITYEVFRDLGLAFGIVLIVIYILIVAGSQLQSTSRAYGPYPPEPGRHHPRPCPDGRVLHRHVHDRLHCRGRNRGA